MKYMKYLLILICPYASAQSQDLLSVPGLTNAVATYAKQAKAIGLVDFNGTLGTGAFLPIRTLHDSSNVNYLEFGIGGNIKQGQHVKPLVITDLDISAIWRRAENFSWYNSHVSKIILPDVWLGPYLDPLSFTTWKNWKQCLGGTVTIGL